MILSSFWYHSGILGFLHVKFIADFRMMVMACSGHQFFFCRQFTYSTIIPPTMSIFSFLTLSLFCKKLFFCLLVCNWLKATCAYMLVHTVLCVRFNP